MVAAPLAAERDVQVDAAAPQPPRPVLAVPMVWLLAVQVPLVIAYGNFLWARPHYQFFPLAILAAIVLAVVRLRQGVELPPGRSKTSLLLFIGAVTLQFVAFLLHSYWLVGVSLVISLVAYLHAAGGWRGVFRCWPSLGLLGLSVYLPFGLDQLMVLALRELTSDLGSAMLNLSWIGLPHLQNGNVLNVGDRQLFVEDACSGVNSLFSSLCFVLVWAGFSRIHWFETLILMLTAIVWLVAANTLRVVLVAVSEVWWGVDLATGDIDLGFIQLGKHETLGVATFALGLFLTWNTRQLFLLFFQPRQTGKIVPTLAQNSAQTSPRLLCSRVAAALVIGGTMLATAGFVAFYRGDYRDLFGDQNKRLVVNRLEKLAREDLAAEGAGWRIDDFKVEKRTDSNALGEYSRSWTGRIDRSPAVASADYTFPLWHDLTVCYRGQGWEMGAVKEIPSPLGDDAKIQEVVMSRPGFHSGYLLYTLIDTHGETMKPPAAFSGTRGWLRPDSFLAFLIRQGRPATDLPKTCQVQVFVVCGSEPDPKVRAAAADLFKAACLAVKTKLTDEAGQ